MEEVLLPTRLHCHHQERVIKYASKHKAARSPRGRTKALLSVHTDTAFHPSKTEARVACHGPALRITDIRIIPPNVITQSAEMEALGRAVDHVLQRKLYQS